MNIATGSGTTLLHELEHRLGVPYRFEAEFQIQESKCMDCPLENKSWVSYVRNLDDSGSEADFALFSKVIRGQEFLKRAKLGAGSLTLYNSLDALRFLGVEMVSQPFILTSRGKVGMSL
jgi:aminoglycoside N3'-acetyltransferase